MRGRSGDSAGSVWRMFFAWYVEHAKFCSGKSEDAKKRKKTADWGHSTACDGERIFPSHAAAAQRLDDAAEETPCACYVAYTPCQKSIRKTTLFCSLRQSVTPPLAPCLSQLAACRLPPRLPPPPSATVTQRNCFSSANLLQSCNRALCFVFLCLSSHHHPQASPLG